MADLRREVKAAFEPPGGVAVLDAGTVGSRRRRCPVY
jgi:hypothetical protein